MDLLFIFYQSTLLCNHSCHIPDNELSLPCGVACQAGAKITNLIASGNTKNKAFRQVQRFLCQNTFFNVYVLI